MNSVKSGSGVFKAEGYSGLCLMAVQLAANYEAGFLPESGGWMEQDALFMTLMEEALVCKRQREHVEEQKRQRRSNKH